MKLLLSFLLLISCFGAFAQTSTIVVVSPRLPVSCLTDNHKLVNWIYELETVREDSDEAIVQFKTQYGHCINGRTQPYIIETGLATAFAVQNSFRWPWQKEGVKTELSYLTNAEVLITLTLNKRILFKKGDENHLSFYFEPGAQTPVYRMDPWGRVQTYFWRYQFPWNIDLYLDGEEIGNSSIRVLIR